MRKYLQTPGLLSVSLKTALSFSLAFILMLFSASALEAGSDEALITDTLRQTGITEPIQLSQWGDTAACFAETDGVKRLILLERHDGAWQIEIDNPTALIQDSSGLTSCRIRRSCGITVTAMRTADGVRWISSTATAASVNTPISGTRPGTV